jgi:ketosteroid isomerase-like protein
VSIEEENIKLVQQLYSAFSKGDIDTIISMLSPEVEWSEPPNPYNPAGGTRYGHKGFLEWINIGRQAEEILYLNLQKMLTDSDSVAVTGNMKCLAVSTGRTYESDFVHLITIRDGKVTRFQEFFDTYLAGEAFRE